MTPGRKSAARSAWFNYNYLYTGLGDRVQQTVSGVTTTYTLDLNTGLTQVLSDGTDAYLYGLSRIGEVDTAWDYYLGDALGSVRQLADVNGVVSLAQAFEPYGEAWASVGTGSSSYAFTGEALDVSGFQYLRARYLDPSVGRFINMDPSRLEPNSYLYARANPILLIDPTGFLTEEAIASGFNKNSWLEVVELFENGGEFANKLGYLQFLLQEHGWPNSYLRLLKEDSFGEQEIFVSKNNDCFNYQCPSGYHLPWIYRNPYGCYVPVTVLSVGTFNNTFPIRWHEFPYDWIEGTSGGVLDFYELGRIDADWYQELSNGRLNYAYGNYKIVKYVDIQKIDWVRLISVGLGIYGGSAAAICKISKQACIHALVGSVYTFFDTSSTITTNLDKAEMGDEDALKEIFLALCSAVPAVGFGCDLYQIDMALEAGNVYIGED